MKSVLVIDTPPCCEDCPCSTLVKAPQKTWEAYCELCEKFNNRIMTKPEWCPLKPMPNKKSVKATKEQDILSNMITIAEATGWNDCLDELLGEDK